VPQQQGGLVECEGAVRDLGLVGSLDSEQDAVPWVHVRRLVVLDEVRRDPGDADAVLALEKSLRLPVAVIAGMSALPRCSPLCGLLSSHQAGQEEIRPSRSDRVVLPVVRFSLGSFMGSALSMEGVWIKASAWCSSTSRGRIAV
jgi:hypothetical protein